MRWWYSAATWLILGGVVALDPWVPKEAWGLYPRATPAQLLGEHAGLVLVPLLAAFLVGLPVGWWLGSDSSPGPQKLVAPLIGLGQAMPPIVTLLLSIPFLGLGLGPSWFCLSLYALCPVVNGVVLGLRSLPSRVVGSAQGLGLGWWRSTWWIEFPLVLPYLILGLRVALVTVLGTATLAALVGGGGIGSPLAAGLATQNPTYLIEGTVLSLVLVMAADAPLAAWGWAVRARIGGPSR